MVRWRAIKRSTQGRKNHFFWRSIKASLPKSSRPYGKNSITLWACLTLILSRTGHGRWGVLHRVTYFTEGIGLNSRFHSKRRVTLPMDNLFNRPLWQSDACIAFACQTRIRFQLIHGDVQARNVHIAPNGRVLLSGVGRWDNGTNLDVMEKVWDGAGLAALIYQMLRATKLNEESPQMSPAMDDLLRVALGIGSPDEFISAKTFGMRLREIAIRQHVYTTLDRFRDLAHRTWRIVEDEKQAALEKQVTLDDDDIDITFDDIEDDENDSVAAEELEISRTFNNESSSVEISVTEVALEGIQNTPDGAERTVKPLPALNQSQRSPKRNSSQRKRKGSVFFNGWKIKMFSWCIVTDVHGFLWGRTGHVRCALE